MLEPLVSLEHVSRIFRTRRGLLKAVDDVSFAIAKGEIVCLVGESGCGKTTTGKLVAGLFSPSSGHITFKGQDIAHLKKQEYKDYRLGVQMVHQDPYSSLNPAYTVYDALAFPLRRHGITQNEEENRRRVHELLDRVNLSSELIDKFPHQLSGGQRQRVSVARSLTVNPVFLVADEVVSMVDASIRINLLNMLACFNEQLGLAVLFITHDLALARYFAWEGRIGVMYLGRLVELAPTQQLMEHPQHPYTQALLSAVPGADLGASRGSPALKLRSLDVPSLLHLPTGCTFHPRCPRFFGELCQTLTPEMVQFKDGSMVACHLAQREWRVEHPLLPE